MVTDSAASVLREDKIERVRKAGAALGVDRLVLIHGGFVDERAEGVRPVALARFLMDASAVLEDLR